VHLRMRLVGAVVALVLLVTTGAGQGPQFEVASVKPSPEGRASRFMLQPGGRLVATGATAQLLIGRAFDLPAYAIDGLPPWASKEKFEIQAKAAERQKPFGSTEVVERFGLQTHTESRIQPVFFLTRAQPDRPLSPNFRPATAGCAGKRPADIGPTPGGACGIRSTSNPIDGSVTITYQGRTLPEFASELQRRSGRPVLDRTNIQGQFDIDLVQSREVDLSTALREHLGLRLVSDQAPIEMLIVDAIHRPTPD
jgi:uncharacterized protein (TIGR03435 family)